MASLSSSGNNLASSPVVTESFDSSTTSSSSKSEIIPSQVKNNKADTPISTTSGSVEGTSNISSASAAKIATNTEITDAAFGENNAQIGGIRLAQFIQNIDDYTPTIPDDVTSYHLNRAGFDTTDPRVIRLISLTCQKFVSDIVGDAMQQCKMRGSNLSSKKGAKDKHYCLTMEDLAAAVNEYGVNIKKPHYYS